VINQIFLTLIISDITENPEKKVSGTIPGSGIDDETINLADTEFLQHKP